MYKKKNFTFKKKKCKKFYFFRNISPGGSPRAHEGLNKIHIDLSLTKSLDNYNPNAPTTPSSSRALNSFLLPSTQNDEKQGEKKFYTKKKKKFYTKKKKNFTQKFFLRLGFVDIC